MTYMSPLIVTTGDSAAGPIWYSGLSLELVSFESFEVLQGEVDTQTNLGSVHKDKGKMNCRWEIITVNLRMAMLQIVN